MDRKQAQKLANQLAEQIKATPPRVRVAKLGRAGWSGRYFPKSGTVMVRFGRRRCAGTKCDHDMKRELLAHELAHWATRVRYCGETRTRSRAMMKAERAALTKDIRAIERRIGRKLTKTERRKFKRQLAPKRARTCKSYRGEHNQKFYGVLDRVQRYFGNSKQRARALEARAGYRPPPDYQR